VVGGDDQRRTAAIEGIGLQRAPQALEPAVVTMQRLEHGLVAAVVGEVVGLVEGDVQNARVVLAQVGERELERVGVGPHVLPRGGRVELHLAETLDDAVGMVVGGGPGVHEERPRPALRHEAEDVPRREHRRLFP